jgi:hypothetical protein
MSWKGAKGEKLMLNDLFTDFQWRVVLTGKKRDYIPIDTARQWDSKCPGRSSAIEVQCFQLSKPPEKDVE